VKSRIWLIAGALALVAALLIGRSFAENAARTQHAAMGVAARVDVGKRHDRVVRCDLRRFAKKRNRDMLNTPRKKCRDQPTWANATTTLPKNALPCDQSRFAKKRNRDTLNMP
jgi:hypothetical protein